MSNCNNCFNGCTETISDQCVKYTGIDIPTLGIQTSDPLSVIEQSLITFLVSALNGTGIKIDLSSIDVCTVVQKYLPTCGEMSIADISKALIEAACDIQVQVDAIVATLAILNADYTIPVGPSPTFTPCLTGVTSSSDTHAIVQATIIKLCSVSSSVDSLITQLPLYVPRAELCTLVTECISGESGIALASSKMLPYSPIPYYGDISNYPAVGDSFDGTGAGLGYWARVFMCNGQNGTPDLRGRVPVGATNTPSTNSFPTQTDPSIPGNFTYVYKNPTTGIRGTNTVQLSLPQMPLHTHAATVTINDPGHTHALNNAVKWAGAIARPNGSGISMDYLTQTATGFTGLNGTNVLINNATQGNNEAHSNVQPGLAVYYIMYIPV